MNSECFNKNYKSCLLNKGLSVEENYVPYGPEWEKEMSKFSKPFLISFLKRNLLKIKTVEDILQQHYAGTGPSEKVVIELLYDILNKS